MTTSTPAPAVRISGNTYPVRIELRALGGRWDADGRCWWVPSEHAAEALALLPAPTVAPSRTGWTRCTDCGDRVQRGTPCWETGLQH